MRKLLAVALVLVAIAMTAPTADAWARGGHGGWVHGGHGHFHGGRVFVGVGVGFPGWWGYPYPYPYYGGYPYYSYPPPVVYTAPAAQYQYAPPAPTASEPAAVQREVVYPHGRYVLEGDGVNTPYKWVWFSNDQQQPR